MAIVVLALGVVGSILVFGLLAIGISGRIARWAGQPSTISALVRNPLTLAVCFVGLVPAWLYVSSFRDVRADRALQCIAVGR